MYNKYKNTTCYYNGLKFSSKKEACRYRDLKLLERVGKIKNLQTQVEYVLIPKQDGERKCSYYADFVYVDTTTGETVVEDVKAAANFKTDVYKIKRKLMLYVYNIKIKEVY